jgi:hypothetical protein
MTTHANDSHRTAHGPGQRGSHVRSARAALAAGAAASLLGLGALSLMGGAAPAGAATKAASYPNASTAGVPAGTQLTAVPGQATSGPGWSWKSAGYVQVTGDGAVLSNLSVAGNINVAASNVTIKDVKVVNSGADSMGISLRHTSNVTIENSTIAGSDASSGRLMVGVKDVYGDDTGTQVLDDNIYQTGTGVQIYQGLIQGNYIHDLGFIAGDHVNGVTTNGGTSQLTIEHNTILNPYNQTDAVGLFEDFGVVANVTIDNNLLGGGGYSIYGGNGSMGTPYNIKVTNNRFSTTVWPNGGLYGPVAYFNSSASGDVWSGNVWDSTGQTIPAP